MDYFQRLFKATDKKLTLAVQTQGYLEGTLKSIADRLNNPIFDEATTKRIMLKSITEALAYSEDKFIELQSVKLEDYK